MNSYIGSYKLWGVINTSLTNGSYYLNIYNSYDVSALGAGKYASVNAGATYFVTPNKLLVGNMIAFGLVGLAGSIWLTVIECQAKKKEL